MSMLSSSPAAATFVGRGDALTQLAARLDEGSAVLSLVGPPGIGKTRLARALAQATGKESAWVELARAATPVEVCARIAHALDLRLSWIEPADLVEELGWAVAAREGATLYLDEVEGCVAAVGEVLARWQAINPELRVVLTSRERVGVSAEVVFELTPLSPDDSLSLLASRAGVPESPDLAALATALDGNPLAIELAAARLSLLSAREVLERLGGSLEVLEAPAPAGRTTLREALEGSWRHLDADAQRGLARCAIFGAPFRVGVAETVLGDGALHILQALRDKSLVARAPRSRKDAPARLMLYASVRAFAAERLTTEERDDAERQLVAALVTSTRGHLEALEGPESSEPVQELTADLEDLRTALARANAPEERATLTLGVARVLATRGPQLEALPLLREAEQAGTDLDPAARAALALAHGRALEVVGRVDDAIETLRAPLSEAIPARLRARLLTSIARAELARGQLAEARAACAEALDCATDLERVDALRARAVAAHASGDLSVAFDDYDAARHLALERSDDARAARLRADIGAVRLAERRLGEAREHYDAALAELDPVAQPIALGLAEGNLAILEQEQGSMERAEALYDAGIARLRRTGHRLFSAHLMGYSGSLLHERGELGRAVDRYDQALATLRRIGDARLSAIIAALAGAAEAQRGHAAAAEERFAAAAAALEAVDDPSVRHAVAIHRAHLALGDADSGRAEALALLEEPAPDSDDVRLASRILSAALGRGALSIGESVLVLPTGERLDLSTRLVLWRIVQALAQARRESPGDALSTESLIAAGWPGEAMTGASGPNRLKVALSTLRKLGLRPWLLRADGGYLLDPAVPLAES